MASKLKGNVVVAQSGGPTAVINAAICGAVETCLKNKAVFPKVFGATNGIMGVLQEDLFDMGKETKQTIAMMRQTPAAAVGSCRYKLTAKSDREYARIIEVFKAHNVRYFFYSGGNDSMDTADKVNKLAKKSSYDLRVMGIPKTIDNDLAHTDHCPGFGSVAKYVATAAMEAGRDTEALYTCDTCTILEVMGRNAGWIAAAAGMASREAQDAPHMILVPEIAFNMKIFVSEAKKIMKKHKRLFIVASEGLKTKDGEYLSADTGKFGKDSFGHKQLGGAAEAIKAIVEEKLGIKARCNKLGTNQRAASHFASKTDVDEAYLCGRTAAEHAAKGVSGKMVTLVRKSNKPYKCVTGLADLSAVANGEKFLPRDFMNKSGTHITAKARAYFLPLIKGEAPCTIGPDGLPVFMRFKRQHVKKVCPKFKLDN